jgi:uncharacterized protein (TIGR04255 family)
MRRELPTRLKREPLVEATWEVRFSSSQSAIVELLTSVILDAMKGAVADVDRLPAANIPPQLREADPNLKYVPTLRLKGEQYVVGLSEHSVSLSCTRNYPGWHVFRQSIKDLALALRTCTWITTPERFSLKYVDMLTFRQPPTMESLAITVRLGDLPLTTEAVMLRIEFQREGFVNVVQVGLPARAKLLSGEELNGAVVDVDTVFVWTDGADASGFWVAAERRVDDAHAVNKEIFFTEILTSDTVAAHGPEY